jgi:hypothetical protein
VKRRDVAEVLTSPNGDGHTRTFAVVDGDRYRLSIPEFALTLEMDRLRRERHELIGELSVYSALPGARVVGGALSIADLNLSSARARQDRAKLLALRSQAETLDWIGVMEEFCQRVLAADREGQPAVDLRTLPRVTDDDQLEVEGLSLLRRHPTILFGDGGAAKSYLSLYLAGRLAERGMRVALFDWELAGEDHRERLERLFGLMPRVMYARCERPLVYEADRLRRIVRDEGIEFSVFDSVAFACDGPPEAAEIAGRYFRAVREIGGGSLHVAHVNKSDNGDQKPFGSTFWHNGARATWFIKASEAVDDAPVLTVGLFNRKANLGPLRPPLGFRITFGETRTAFARTDVRECPDMAGSMTVRQRMAAVLRHGAMEAGSVAKEIDSKHETVTRIARRYKGQFVILDGGKVGLLSRESL